MYNIAFVCGVWDRLHAGHRKLIKHAVENTKLLQIYVLKTNVHGDDPKESNRKVDQLQPYNERVKQVEDYITSLGVVGKVEIIKDVPYACKMVEEDKLRVADCAFVCTKDRNAEYLEIVKIAHDHISKLEGPEGHKPFVLEWIDPVIDDEGKDYASSRIRKTSIRKRRAVERINGGYR